MKIKLSQKQWEAIGKFAQWIPKDPMDFSDADLGPLMTPDEEEEAIFGPDEDDDPYHDGLVEGTYKRKMGDYDTSGNSYRVDTEAGQKKFDEWMRGFKDGWENEGFEETARI